MKTVIDLFRIGRGPSSSHSMGPELAARLFLSENPQADRFLVRLYGSLALTGKGHGTDRVLREIFASIHIDIEFVNHTNFPLPHPNTMDLFAYRGDKLSGQIRVLSIGGGEIRICGRETPKEEECYPHQSFREIARFCEKEHLTLSEYVRKFDRPELFRHLADAWSVMKKSIDDGLLADGFLPGKLHTKRKAQKLYDYSVAVKDENAKALGRISAYAFAVSEQNATGGVIVTAPTCGSCGVLPAVLKQAQEQSGYRDEQIVDALAAAGIIGNIVRTNASISGAECGCQAEIGTACSMAAVALSQLRGHSLQQMDYAAEIAMEHQIGLTCDPICGLVQIPCIERNAVAAQRAVHAVILSEALTGTQKIPFDSIVTNMFITGKDLQSSYRETSLGGLAKLYQQDKI